MKVIEPSIKITFYLPEDGIRPEEAIEAAGRTCYKSEDKINETSADKFVRMIRKRGHNAMLEFGYATARIIADRGLTHELVRHRLASFAEESTRYCNYSKGKFGSKISIIAQPFKNQKSHKIHLKAANEAMYSYQQLLDLGEQPQLARAVLPISLKTEIVIGANLREWRHIFKMRCDTPAHPIIRAVMLNALDQFYKKMPSIYEDQAQEYFAKAENFNWSLSNIEKVSDDFY